MKNCLKFLYVDFHGPLPHHNGNLCIIGHNYKNTMMFSKLDKLNINDEIFISDVNKNKKSYIIYDKYTIKENDLNPIKETNNIELTLITCNNSNNKKRTVIKAKMKEH